MKKLPSLNEILNEGMELQWNYMSDGSPSAFTNIDGGELVVQYMAPMNYNVYFNKEYAGNTFSLKSGMKLAEGKYAK